MAALSRLDLDVRDGEFLSLLGPSGCGKSTALRIMAGLSEPSRGSVTWPGGEGRQEIVKGRDIGFVFQEPTLMPWASVRDNVFLPLKLAGADRATSIPRVMEALSRVGIADFATAYPRELSGGMKMRVSIARALVTAPRVLLMDEPFAALDEITRFKLNDDLMALWRELQMTVVFVTHSVFESVYLSQRVVVMTRAAGPRRRPNSRLRRNSVTPASAPRPNMPGFAGSPPRLWRRRWPRRREWRHERAGAALGAAGWSCLRSAC